MTPHESLIRRKKAAKDGRQYPRPQSQRPTIKALPKRPLTTARGPGWEPDAPARITSATKITIAPPLPERALRTNTHTTW